MFFLFSLLCNIHHYCCKFHNNWYQSLIEEGEGSVGITGHGEGVIPKQLKGINDIDW